VRMGETRPPVVRGMSRNQLCRASSRISLMYLRAAPRKEVVSSCRGWSAREVDESSSFLSWLSLVFAF